MCFIVIYYVAGFAGTPGYLSPEVLRKDPYGKPVDIWACGKFFLHAWSPFDFAFQNKCDVSVSINKTHRMVR